MLYTLCRSKHSNRYMHIPLEKETTLSIFYSRPLEGKIRFSICLTTILGRSLKTLRDWFTRLVSVRILKNSSKIGVDYGF